MERAIGGRQANDPNLDYTLGEHFGDKMKDFENATVLPPGEKPWTGLSQADESKKGVKPRLTVVLRTRAWTDNRTSG
ncbi:hypothetical protein AVEN_262223-1 [Araneus ventricosus]|uniref:Uncharacterized protein n=1 Tax=Araneus ventricosus TaxID=182803 RepID=A0A4Y2JA27_ARAVE|nr:hypothetical protein AVEN_262223-1 [Araneus ventricosus]